MVSGKYQLYLRGHQVKNQSHELKLKNEQGIFFHMVLSHQEYLQELSLIHI